MLPFVGGTTGPGAAQFMEDTSNLPAACRGQTDGGDVIAVNANSAESIAVTIYLFVGEYLRAIMPVAWYRHHYPGYQTWDGCPMFERSAADAGVAEQFTALATC